jgi:hypothetical protein
MGRDRRDAAGRHGRRRAPGADGRRGPVRQPGRLRSRSCSSTSTGRATGTSRCSRRAASPRPTARPSASSRRCVRRAAARGHRRERAPLHRGGDEAAAGLLAREPRPTAVFCLSDSIACGVYVAAAAAGPAIPETSRSPATTTTRSRASCAAADQRQLGPARRRGLGRRAAGRRRRGAPKPPNRAHVRVTPLSSSGVHAAPALTPLEAGRAALKALSDALLLSFATRRDTPVVQLARGALLRWRATRGTRREDTRASRTRARGGCRPCAWTGTAPRRSPGSCVRRRRARPPRARARSASPGDPLRRR